MFLVLLRTIESSVIWCERYVRWLELWQLFPTIGFMFIKAADFYFVNQRTTALGFIDESECESDHDCEFYRVCPRICISFCINIYMALNLPRASSYEFCHIGYACLTSSDIPSLPIRQYENA